MGKGGIGLYTDCAACGPTVQWDNLGVIGPKPSSPPPPLVQRVLIYTYIWRKGRYELLWRVSAGQQFT
jgi:hypothetical protein